MNSNKMVVACYIKHAKYWESRSREIRDSYWEYFNHMFETNPYVYLEEIYIDITDKKHVYERPEMLRLLLKCLVGEIDIILTPTRAYLAANLEEFCYLYRFLDEMEQTIDLLTEDDDMPINTIINCENQSQNLLVMSHKLTSDEGYSNWKKRVILKIKNLQTEK